MSYAKLYIPWIVLARFWGVGHTKFQNTVFEVADVLFEVMDEIDIEGRKSVVPAPGTVFAPFSFIVDVTESKTRKPLDKGQERLEFSHTVHARSLKYEVSTSVVTGRISRIGGGVPSAQDKKNYDKDGIITELPYEFGLGDKDDEGGKNLLVPYKKKRHGPKLTAEQEATNMLITTARIMVERTIGRLKVFRCLCDPCFSSLWRHQAFFMVLSNIVNLSLDVHPLVRKIDPIFTLTNIGDPVHVQNAIDMNLRGAVFEQRADEDTDDDDALVSIMRDVNDDDIEM